MKVLSLFDGISCGILALQRAGISVERYVAYEIDKYAIQISEKNFPQIERCGDVTKADFKQYRDFDLVIGGSPCQGFSLAGKQLNFNDPRSKLFFEFVRAIKEVNPKYFLLENTLMKKEYEDVITKYMGVKPIMINSQLVSAQQRKRLYWTNIPNIVSPKKKEIYLEDIVEPDALVDRNKAHAIIASIGRTTHREYFKKNQGQMVYLAIELSNIYGGFKETKPRVHLRKSVTIRAGQGGGHIPSLIIEGKAKEFSLEDFKKCIRKVTPLECERLQTLPDNYTEGISNTQRYKCIGNAWTVDVIADIFSHLKDILNEEVIHEKLPLPNIGTIGR
nr:MAG TPA: Cytosine specific methyltransferase [Caudoviricetes sp.]